MKYKIYVYTLNIFYFFNGSFLFSSLNEFNGTLQPTVFWQNKWPNDPFYSSLHQRKLTQSSDKIWVQLQFGRALERRSLKHWMGGISVLYYNIICIATTKEIRQNAVIKSTKQFDNQAVITLLYINNIIDANGCRGAHVLIIMHIYKSVAFMQARLTLFLSNPILWVNYIEFD